MIDLLFLISWLPGSGPSVGFHLSSFNHKKEVTIAFLIMKSFFTSKMIIGATLPSAALSLRLSSLLPSRLNPEEQPPSLTYAYSYKPYKNRGDRL
jgi:hypothetical protein